MKKNMAVGDCFLRFVLAVVMIGLFYSNDFSVAANAVLLTVAGIFIFTAVKGSCPLYSLFRIDTRQFKY